MRDRLFVAVMACFLCAVLAGYVFTYATGRTFNRINFGLLSTAPKGTVALVEKLIVGEQLREVATGAQQARYRTFFVAISSATTMYCSATPTALRLRMSGPMSTCFPMSPSCPWA